MNNLNIKRTYHITCDLTAEQWDLYTSEYPEDCRLAALDINRELEECINKRHHTKERTLRDMLVVMDRHQDVGACDSEPLYILEKILDEIYSK